MEQETLLEAAHLTVGYPGAASPVLHDVSFRVYPGKITCIIGESGCGKSTLLHAVWQLPGRVEILQGSVCYRDRNLKDLSSGELRRMRGTQIGVVFQEPGASLDPIRKIQVQFYEAMKAHDRSVTKARAREKAAGILKNMEFEDPDRILRCCPAQLSGGMNQRVAIALAMSLDPKLLVADEPTSALDVTVQAQIVEELMRLRDVYGTSILLITHNMGVVSKMADYIAVMYAGRILEYGKKEDVLTHPAHPYTKALLEAVPRLDGKLPKGIPGRKPDVFPGEGCAFAPRCPRACGECETRSCERKMVGEEHWTLCPEEM